MQTRTLLNPSPQALTPDELKGFSLARALRAAAGMEDGCLEEEISQELRRRGFGSEKYGDGLIIPFGALTRQLNSVTPGEGAEGVFARATSFVDLIRARSVTASLGATVLPDLREDFSIVRQAGSAGATWLPELPGSDAADSELSLSRTSVSPLTLMTTTSVTMQLLRASALNERVEAVVERDIATAFANEWDRSALGGDGAANNPLGLLNRTGLQVHSLGANGAAPSWSDVVELEALVAEVSSDIEDGSLGYATTPTARKFLKQTERFAGAGPIWDGRTMNGHPAVASKNVPEDLSKGAGSNLHAVIFGRWSELLIGLWGVVEVIADPYRLGKQGIVEMTGFMMVNVGFRHEESFAAILDAVV